MEEVFIKVGENSVEEVAQVDSGTRWSNIDRLLTESTLTHDSVVTGCLFMK